MGNFKLLKAYDANGDITKTWYLYYYYQHPVMDKYERFRETFDLNRFKNPKQRKEVLYEFLHAKKILLQNGWNPFESANNETTS